MVNAKIMTLQEVSGLVQRSPKTIWRWWAKDKTFPKPIQINGRCIGWPESVYQAWLDQMQKGAN